MAQAQVKLTFEPEYKFDWYEHEFYTVDDNDSGRMNIKCFCENTMVYNKGKMVCKTKSCNFAVDMASLNLFLTHNMLKNNTIKLPICKTCNGSVLECYRNPVWSTYLHPMFRCVCRQDSQMVVSYSQFPKIMDSNFDIPHKDKLEEQQLAVGKVLPKKVVVGVVASELEEKKKPLEKSKPDKKKPKKTVIVDSE